MIPSAARTMITKPIGTPANTGGLELSINVGITSGSAGVKVGRRVGTTVTMNCAASVGSIVAVTNGVGVGGGSIIGKFAPGERSTRGAKTQAVPLVIPG